MERSFIVRPFLSHKQFWNPGIRKNYGTWSAEDIVIHKEMVICPVCDGCGREAGPHGLAGKCQWCKGTGQNEVEDYIEDEEEEDGD